MKFRKNRARVNLPQKTPPEVAAAARIVAGHVAEIIRESRPAHARMKLRKLDARRLHSAFVVLDELDRSAN